MGVVPRIGVSLALMIGAASNASTAWPEVAVPVGAQRQTVAADVILNGRPAHIVRFEVGDDQQAVLAFYRSTFGEKSIMQSRVKDDAVIATRQGEHFTTVQLHPIGTGRMQGTVLITKLLAKPLVTDINVDTRRLLPPDSQVVSTMQSNDAGKRSMLLTALNLSSRSANRDHVVQGLEQRGFRLMREDFISDKRNPSILLLLSSAIEDAEVVIADAGAYRSIYINRVKENH